MTGFRVFELIDKDVYNLMGKYVGHVTDVLIDSEARSVSAVEVKIEGRRDKLDSGVVLVPYELIVAAGDIVLIGSRK